MRLLLRAGQERIRVQVRARGSQDLATSQVTFLFFLFFSADLALSPLGGFRLYFEGTSEFL